MSFYWNEGNRLQNMWNGWQASYLHAITCHQTDLPVKLNVSELCDDVLIFLPVITSNSFHITKRKRTKNKYLYVTICNILSYTYIYNLRIANIAHKRKLIAITYNYYDQYST
jgi:hypothetical protein